MSTDWPRTGGSMGQPPWVATASREAMTVEGLQRTRMPLTSKSEPEATRVTEPESVGVACWFWDQAAEVRQRSKDAIRARMGRSVPLSYSVRDNSSVGPVFL